MIKNMKHIMSKTNCCSNYSDSDIVNSSFSLGERACFEVLDFLNDYENSLLLLTEC